MYEPELDWESLSPREAEFMEVATAVANARGYALGMVTVSNAL